MNCPVSNLQPCFISLSVLCFALLSKRSRKLAYAPGTIIVFMQLPFAKLLTREALLHSPVPNGHTLSLFITSFYGR